MIRELLLLEALDLAERRILGHDPVYAPERMYGGLGRVLRIAYAPAVAWMKRRTGLPALVFGPLLAAVELVAMPLAGATPKVRKWRKGEVPLLFAHATAFALLGALGDTLNGTP